VYNTLLNYMVLSLYTLHPPRRNIDYSLMKISNNMSDDMYNYLDMDKNNLYLITIRLNIRIDLLLILLKMN